MTLPAEELFDSAVLFYARYRSGYPDALFDLLTARLGLTPRHRVVDIGCGTGQLSIPLARRVAEVIAVDPVAGMLNYGRAAARRAGVANVDWRQGDSGRLATLGLGTPDTAVFAASFHWTDRAAVLADLDRLLATDGAVVVINDVQEDHPDWVPAITEIRERYLGPRPAFSAVSHRAVLESSPFSSVEAETLTWSRELSVEQVVGLQFSYSFSTPALFGDRAESFARDVGDAVRALCPSGEVTEDIAVEVLISRRSR